MMMADDGEYAAKRFKRRADFFADDGMLSHDFCFRRVQGSGFKKDTFRDSDFADVVKPAGTAEFLQVFFFKTKTFPQLLCVVHQKFRMAIPHILLRVDTLSQGKYCGLRLLIHVNLEV